MKKTLAALAVLLACVCVFVLPTHSAPVTASAPAAALYVTAPAPVTTGAVNCWYTFAAIECNCGETTPGCASACAATAQSEIDAACTALHNAYQVAAANVNACIDAAGIECDSCILAATTPAKVQGCLDFFYASLAECSSQQTAEQYIADLQYTLAISKAMSKYRSCMAACCKKCD